MTLSRFRPRQPPSSSYLGWLRHTLATLGRRNHPKADTSPGAVRTQPLSLPSLYIYPLPLSDSSILYLSAPSLSHPSPSFIDHPSSQSHRVFVCPWRPSQLQFPSLSSQPASPVDSTHHHNTAHHERLHRCCGRPGRCCQRYPLSLH